MSDSIEQKRRVGRHNEKSKRKRMKPFNLTDEDKEKLLKQHKDATKEVRDKQQSYKDGIQVPDEKKKEEKK